LWEVEYKQGWQHRTVTAREVAGIQGSAFAAGMAAYNRYIRAGNQVDYGVVELAIEAAVAQHVGVLHGQGFDLGILAQYGDLTEALTRSVRATCAEQVVPEGWEVVAVEEPRPIYGNARCDVVYLRPDGGRVVRDYKYTQSIDKKWVPQRLQDYSESAQRHHYLWMEGADTFVVTLVQANPFKIYEQAFALDVKRSTEWLKSQRVKWGLMEKMERRELPLFESDSHITKYGRGDSAKCVLYEWCLEYGRDPKALEVIGFIRTRGVL